MELIELIKTRRSIRRYKKEPVNDSVIMDILEAGRWAPSGLNNQPWRFIIIKDNDFKKKLSALTRYSAIVSGSDFCIGVFFNIDAGYDRDKDMMGLGACIQNMLLYSHSIGIGSVWLGEILKNKDKVNEILGVESGNEFMALIAFGIPDETGKSNRKKIDDLILKKI
jgi:nitroreductase